MDGLLDAAFERYPYCRLKDHVVDLGVLSDWFAYYNERMREVAQDWFGDKGLIPAEEVASNEKFES